MKRVQLVLVGVLILDLSSTIVIRYLSINVMDLKVPHLVEIKVVVLSLLTALLLRTMCGKKRPVTLILSIVPCFVGGISNAIYYFFFSLCDVAPY